MYTRHQRQLIAWGLTGWLLCVTSVSAQSLELMGQIVWREDAAEGFGGFSALYLSDEGQRLTAITDRGQVALGRIERDGNGRMIDIALDRMYPLQGPQGGALGRYFKDSEAITKVGSGFMVSFEGQHRVVYYPRLSARARPRPGFEAFENFALNGGIEALATDPEGGVLAIPETPLEDGHTHPVLRWDGKSWSIVFYLSSDGNYLPTSAEVGPDGRLYILERWFSLLAGFRIRLRSFALDAEGLKDEQILLSGAPNAYDNAEGMSLWWDRAGALRITLISDNNFNPLQRTLISEFRLNR